MKRSLLSPVLLASVLAAAACSSKKPSTDGGQDAGLEVRAEAGAETSPAGPGDAPPGARDAGPDAPADVAPDAPADAAPDAPAADAAPEVHPACLTIPTTATRTVHLRITADNECDVYVNGTL